MSAAAGGRRGRMRPAWVAAVMVAVAAVAASSLIGCGGDSSAVPTYRVERQDFVRRVPAEGTLKAVRATPLTPPQQAPAPSRIAWLAADGTPVEAGEVVIRLDPTRMEEERQSASDDVEKSRLRLLKHEAELDSRLENLDRDSEAARLEEELADRFITRDPEIFSRLEIIESELDGQLATHRRRHAEQVRGSEERQGLTQEELLELQKQRASRRLERAQEGLSALEVTAPHGGILVIRRDFRGEPVRVGDMVWNNQPIAEIPDLSEMEAEVYVLEADAGGLVEGKPATLIIEAHPEQRYQATIRRIDKLAKPRFRNSPVQYFAVTLELAATDRERMRPGQRVRAELVLDEVPGALVIPRQAVVERDGAPHVLRAEKGTGGGFEPVPVTLGSSGPGRVVVTDGLAAGDLIALADPSGRSPGGAAAGPGEEAGEGEGPLAGALTAGGGGTVGGGGAVGGGSAR